MISTNDAPEDRTWDPGRVRVEKKIDKAELNIGFQ
ncbi:hypothetical protein M2315_001747 [Agrobacterium fabrum]|nr:hypothetical protein [Agrobacterium fabrum]